MVSTDAAQENAMNVRTAGVLAVVAGLLLASPAAGQNADIRTQQALDRQVNLEIPDAPIIEVFDQLQAMTGVKFVLDEEVTERLPYGRETRMSVTLRDVTLRKALTPMLAPQALQWRNEGHAVRIVPAPALRRLGRRATYDELRLLGILYARRLSAPDGDAGALEQVRTLAETPELELDLRVAGDRGALLEKADRDLPATGAQWLDALCRGERWTWYVSGDRIVVLERIDQVRRQLGKQVSLRYQDAELVTVLLDLARKAGVHLTVDPDTMNYVPGETRESFNLIMSDASVAQALEVIGGVTGLAFEATHEGLRVSPSEALKQRVLQPTTRPRQRSPFFVRLSLPGPAGVRIDVFMRADELPEALFEDLDRRRLETLETLGDGLD
jgi:hypothetical protein